MYIHDLTRIYTNLPGIEKNYKCFQGILLHSATETQINTQTFRQLNIFSAKRSNFKCSDDQDQWPADRVIGKRQKMEKMSFLYWEICFECISQNGICPYFLPLCTRANLSSYLQSAIFHIRIPFATTMNTIYLLLFFQYINITHYQNYMYIVHTKRQLHIFSFCQRTPSHATETIACNIKDMEIGVWDNLCFPFHILLSH